MPSSAFGLARVVQLCCDAPFTGSSFSSFAAHGEFERRSALGIGEYGAPERRLPRGITGQLPALPERMWPAPRGGPRLGAAVCTGVVSVLALSKFRFMSVPLNECRLFGLAVGFGTRAWRYS
jgi:hypothetical protein